jgi:hypothetical protein
MATTHPSVDQPFRTGPARGGADSGARTRTGEAPAGAPSLLLRVVCFGIRGALVAVTLLVGLVAGGVIIVPLLIFAPPLPVILAGLAVVYVLGATGSMADDWHARRSRRSRRSRR